MQKYFPLFMLVFLLAACQSAAPTMTPTITVATQMPAPTETVVVNITNTPIPEPSATAEPMATATEIALPPEILTLGLSPEDLKNFATQPDGSVIDKRDGAVAYDAEGKLVSVRYGTGWEVVDGKMQVKDVDLSGLNCVKEGKDCVTDTTDPWYESPAFGVDGVSSGAFEKRPLTLKTGMVGVGDFALVQTQDKNRNSVYFPLLVQIVDNDSPLFNAIPYHMALFKNNYDKSMTGTGVALFAVKPSELENILPSGFILDLGFLKGSNISRIKYNEQKFLYDNFYSNQKYLSSANKYLQSLINTSSVTMDAESYLVITSVNYPNSDKTAE